MYSRTPSASISRRLERHASTILIGGVILCCGVFCFLMLCNMPCDEENLYRARMKGQGAFHEGHEPKKRIYKGIEETPKAKQNKTFLVVLILTGPDNLEHRNAIRDTWLKEKLHNVMSFFVIGLQHLDANKMAALNLENSRYKDLLLLPDFRDSYQALTSKVLEAFTWIEENLEYTYVFKVDDDSYSRLDIIVDELAQEKMPKERLYWGFFYGRAHVKKTGQWAEKNWVLCDYYLPHAFGGGYVLSQDLVGYIVHNQAFLQKFNSEDISVGTWLGPLEIHRIHDPRFDTEWKSRGCSNQYIVTHKQSSEDMHQKDDNLKQTGKLCSKEFQKYKSFNYNWTVPPTKCCERLDSSIP